MPPKKMTIATKSAAFVLRQDNKKVSTGRGAGVAFGALLGKKSIGGAGTGAGGGLQANESGGFGASGGTSSDSHGILEGISSLHSWIKTQTMIRPHQRHGRGKQGAAYDEDLDEDVVITLVAKNPQAPQNKVRFDYTAGEFVAAKMGETTTMISHLDIESTVIHRDSDEARRQIQIEGVSKEGGFKGVSQKIMKHHRKEKVVSMLVNEGNDEDDDEDDEDAPDLDLAGNAKGGKATANQKVRRGDSIGSDDSGTQDKKLQNQFSFVERATQTMNNSMKCDDVQTEPPPRANFSDTVNQWVIYDAYVNYEYAKELQDEKDRFKGKSNEQNESIRRLLGDKEVDKNEEVNRKLLKAARILERMVNQNTFNDIAQDFKYWEDASDEFRETEGTLLPLWKFAFERAKNLEITGLCWNPAYKDLFAASFGSYNFYDQDDASCGVVCVFSLKNPSYPEYLCVAQCGVLCVDVHPNHPHMLAVGLADGNVAVYNLQRKTQRPSYISTARNGKHQDVVWQVRWAKDNLDGYLNFYSVSGDGRVSNWTIVKTALWCTDILSISFTKHLHNFAEEDAKANLKDSGRCVAFNPNDDTMFLVGTDEGLVYKCTTEYSSKFLQTYPAHNTPIYNVCWNPFVPTIFLTCAAEWMVKIWDHNSTKPLFMFDLNSQVGDVAWAPYSSTVFAAVTVDGKVHVFDLHVDKYHPICSQPVVPRKKARLNHVAFNAQNPILVVGDSRGFVQCLKLSPNLRKQTKEVKNAMLNKDTKKALEFEIRKLETLLAMVKEPGEVVAVKEEEDKH